MGAERPDVHPEPSHQHPKRERRKGGLASFSSKYGLGLLFFVVALGLGASLVRAPSRIPSKKPKPQPSYFLLLPPRMVKIGSGPDEGRVLYIDPLHLPPPLTAPLYIANLSTLVDGYTISVRQVLSGRAHLFENVPLAVRLPAGPLVISLQVMSAEHDLQHVQIAPGTTIMAQDETGQLLKGQYVSSFRFPKGLGVLFAFPEPSPSARFLRSVGGVLKLASPQAIQQEVTSRESRLYPRLNQNSPTPVVSPHPSMQELPFQISEVPLPIVSHIYGLCNARLLPSSQIGLNSASSGFILLKGARVDSLHKLFPPFVPDPGPLHLPNRVLLLPGIPSRFRVPIGGVEGGFLKCTVETDLEPYGVMPTHLVFTLPNRLRKQGALTMETSLPVWDHEPVILVLPTDWGPSGMRLVVWMELYLEMPPPLTNNVPPQVCFHLVAPQGEMGGGIQGRVLLDGAPLALGLVKMQLTCLEGPVRGEQDAVWMPLDAEGVWRVQGLFPGKYRVHLMAAQPHISPMVVPKSFRWSEYVRLHNGITMGQWQNPAQVVDVEPGSMAFLKDWCYTPISSSPQNV